LFELKRNENSMFSSWRGNTYWVNLSLYYDLFFSSVGFLCGGILIFQGWRLDPILLLCQLLLSGTTIFFIGESVWLRNTKTKSNVFHLSESQISNTNSFFQVPSNIQNSILFLYNNNMAFYTKTKLFSFYRKSASWHIIDYTKSIEYFSL